MKEREKNICGVRTVWKLEKSHNQILKNLERIKKKKEKKLKNPVKDISNYETKIGIFPIIVESFSYVGYENYRDRYLQQLLLERYL